MSASPSPRNHNGSYEKSHPNSSGYTKVVCPLKYMKNNLAIVKELSERPSAQQLLIHLPIEPFVLAAWMSHPEVQAWALSMSPSERHDAIQKAIDGKLAEVKNIA